MIARFKIFHAYIQAIPIFILPFVILFNYNENTEFIKSMSFFYILVAELFLGFYQGVFVLVTHFTNEEETPVEIKVYRQLILLSALSFIIFSIMIVMDFWINKRDLACIFLSGWIPIIYYFVFSTINSQKINVLD